MTRRRNFKHRRSRDDSHASLEPQSAVRKDRRKQHPQFEVDYIEGLAPWVHEEIGRLGGRQINQTRPGESQFSFKENPNILKKLRLVNSVYQLRTYPIPRPRALLGHQYFTQLCQDISTIQANASNAPFRTLRLAAAGQNSSVFRRLRDELCQATNLQSGDEEADLVIRIRPNPMGGWDTAIRLTPRPLATRPWRIIDMPGAISGPVAAALHQIAKTNRSDRLLNLMCGSGTLLIETADENNRPQQLIGCDLNPQALAAAQSNLQAANVRADLILGDATNPPFKARQFDIVMADLPWGHLVGDHNENRSLYPQTLAAAHRLLPPHGRCLLLTQDKNNLRSAVSQLSHMWRVVNEIPLKQGNFRPFIVVLSPINL